MPTCWNCGEEILIRYMNGFPVPIHISGNWCSAAKGAHAGNPGTVYESIQSFQDTCHKSKCPNCKGQVYFIRHNGGSVFVDSLGWPWPKHGCFDEPNWLVYARERSDTSKKRRSPKNSKNYEFAGVVIAARRLGSESTGYFIGLAIDGGAFGRTCISTEANTPTSFFLASIIVVIQRKKKQIVVCCTSSHQVKPILGFVVGPAELGLDEKWESGDLMSLG